MILPPYLFATVYVTAAGTFHIREVMHTSPRCAVQAITPLEGGYVAGLAVIETVPVPMGAAQYRADRLEAMGAQEPADDAPGAERTASQAVAYARRFVDARPELPEDARSVMLGLAALLESRFGQDEQLRVPRGWQLLPQDATGPMLTALWKAEPGNARPAYEKLLSVAPVYREPVSA
ncbi:hypothetical protein [Lysobacter sp. CA199]|uniref:hypothetical protein n=1 Tax=Lysobacter sp. CA199 TaxID=3455608 RepID=UPI003F8CF8C6